MEWELLLNHGSFGSKRKKELTTERTPFNTDYDRIIFSNSFKRLDAKTQVHPLRNNDNVHSRLTHSLEVSTAGRSLGMNIGLFLEDKKLLPKDFRPEHVSQIVQTACLAHDIGNPPFGHAGESIIRSWFDGEGKIYLEEMSEAERNDFLYFDGNAQSLRILTKIEVYGENGGIKPTYAMIAAMMKYPWVDKTGKGKASAFWSERDVLDDIAEKTGLIKLGENEYVRHPLAYLSEAADDICYTIVDLEDAHELNILSYDAVAELLTEIIAPEKQIDFKNNSERGRLAHLRAIAIGKCISAATKAFEDNHEAILEGNHDYHKGLMDICDQPTANAIGRARTFSRNELYTDARKAVLETGAKRVLHTLLREFCPLAEKTANGDKIGPTEKGLLKMMGDSAPKEGDSHAAAMHRVLDHISGMTDRYAAEMAKQMSGWF